MNAPARRHARTRLFGTVVATSVAVVVATALPAHGAGTPPALGSGRSPSVLDPQSSVGRVVPVNTRTLWTSSRSGLAPMTAHSLRATGRRGVPSTGVRAVFVTVSARGARETGEVLVYPTGNASHPRVAASLHAGRPTSGSTLVRPGRDGEITVRTTTRARIRVDVNAYVAGRMKAPAAPGGVTAIGPVTRMDTRTGLGGRTLRAGRLRTVPVTGRRGVPSTGVSAVIATVLVKPLRGRVAVEGVNPDRVSQRWPMGRGTGREPLVLTTVLPVGRDGRVGLRTSARADARLDVIGWVRAGGDQSTLATIPGGLAPLAESVVAGDGQAPTTVRPGSPLEARVVGVGPVPQQFDAVVLAVSARSLTGRPAALSVSTPGRPDATNAIPVGRWTSQRLEFVRSDAAGAVVLRAVGSAVRVRVSAVAYLPAEKPTAAPAPPQVSITSPVAGAAVNLGDDGQVTVEGTAIDGGAGLARVEILGDGVRVGTAVLDTSVTPAHWRLDIVTPGGVGVITALAVDRAGAQAEASVTVQVVLPPPTQTVATEATRVADDEMRKDMLAADDSTVVLDGARYDVDAGEVLVSAPVEGVAEEGLLVRVLAVDVDRGDDGEQTRLTVERATLADMLVQADTTQQPVEDQPQDAGARSGRAGRAPSFTIPIRIPLAKKFEGEKKGSKDGREYEFTYKVKVGGWLIAEPTFDLSLGMYWKWIVIPVPYVTYFKVGVDVGVEASVKAEAGGKVEWTKTLWAGKTSGKLFLIGFLPVYVSAQPDIAWYLRAEAKVAVTAGYEFKRTIASVYKGDRNGGAWVKQEPFNTSVLQFEGALSGKVSTGLRFTYSIYLYGSVGAGFDIEAGPALIGELTCKVTTKDPLTCKGSRVAFSIDLGVGLKLNLKLLGFNIKEFRWEIVRVDFPICAWPAPTAKVPICSFLPAPKAPEPVTTT